MCEADSQAKIPVPLTRFIVNWTPGVLSLEYYHQLFDTRLSFWMNNPCHLQMLQITRSCRFMSLGLIAFKGQACSETYEYRNTFSSCRHLSTSIENRLKAIISGKPFSFTSFLVSSFLRIMFMRLYFRIIFFTSHYCLCSFIISYLSYLVFLSCSSYFPKLKGRIHEMAPFINLIPERSLKFLQQPFGFNRGRVSKPPGNTMNSTILVPWIWLGGILRVGFCHGCDFHQNADIRPDSRFPPTHRTKTQLFSFWRNKKPPHWDGRCDSVGCPVHTSVLADQTEFLFSSSTGSGF